MSYSKVYSSPPNFHLTFHSISLLPKWNPTKRTLSFHNSKLRSSTSDKTRETTTTSALNLGLLSTDSTCSKKKRYFTFPCYLVLIAFISRPETMLTTNTETTPTFARLLTLRPILTLSRPRSKRRTSNIRRTRQKISQLEILLNTELLIFRN